VVPETEQPISESQPLVPSSPYAVSKIAQEMLGIQYARADGFPVYLSRSFNHTGPRQKETFVCSSFARQIALAERDPDRPEIRVGNLVSRRDFSDVRDVVRAYDAILQKGVPGEPYNVCSGKAVSIEEVLRILLSYSRREVRVSTDPEKFRPTDMPLLFGSSAKLQQQTGWEMLYNIHTTLLDLLDYWRAKIQAGGEA
jgi:GDP-4-dehydro-6-deoxy-D-mannose reductase